jgi:hypothetical protein
MKKNKNVPVCYCNPGLSKCQSKLAKNECPSKDYYCVSRVIGKMSVQIIFTKSI